MGIDANQVTGGIFGKIKIKKWNLGKRLVTLYLYIRHICLDKWRTIEIVQDTYNLAMYKSRIGRVFSAYGPFPNTFGISKELGVQAIIYPQTLQVCICIKKTTEVIKGALARLISGIRRLGELSIVAPGTFVCGRITWRTTSALFRNEQAAGDTNQVGMLLIARVLEMDSSVVNR